MKSISDGWKCVSVKDCATRVAKLLEKIAPLEPGLTPPCLELRRSYSVFEFECSKCPGFIYVVPEEYREHCRSEQHLLNVKRAISPSISPSSAVDEGDKSLYIRGVAFRELIGESLAIPAVVSDPNILLYAKFFAVVLLRSGRFAGAVWDHTGSVVVHTCFKRYTVRRKNGGSQSKNDQSRGGSVAHSAGAQIRRNQEQRLAEEIKYLIELEWKEYLKDPKCVVFAHASKSLIDTLLVGPLDKSKRSCTLFPVPLSIGDPTFSEVCRVFDHMVCFAFKA